MNTIVNILTQKQKEELEKLLIPIVEESISVKLDYEENPSNLDSGSVVVVHQDSTLLENKEEELSDIAYNITRKSSSINDYGDDNWATPDDKKNDEEHLKNIRSEEVTYIDTRVNINNEEWRVAQKTFKYGREWQYTLSHENTDGTYKSINLNETALENIIKSGSRVIGEIK